MLATRCVVAATLLLPLPRATHAQVDAVRLIRTEDAMSPLVYAYARAEGGIIERIDDGVIRFSERDPALVWACVGGSVAVVYRFDTELLGENKTVQVRYRFDDQAPSPTRAWAALSGMSQAQVEFVAAMLAGADSAQVAANPFVQVMMQASLAAQLPADLTDEFLGAARKANKVTLRVTDTMDGETLTDEFLLTGLPGALEVLFKECR